MALAASFVCRVESTRWPVSAAWIALAGGLGVADLADHDDVGILPQDGAQALGEAEPILRLQCGLVEAFEHVLDRVFDGGDVHVSAASALSAVYSVVVLP
jgi:hypothetical protein